MIQESIAGAVDVSSSPAQARFLCGRKLEGFAATYGWPLVSIGHEPVTFYHNVNRSRISEVLLCKP